MSIKSAYSTLRTDQFDTPRVADAHADADERTYATFMHLALFAAVLTSGGLIVSVPLVMWLFKRKKSPFIDDHGKEAINFQITMVVYSLAIGLAALATCGVGVVIFLPLLAYAMIFTVVAARAANRGEYYRYPACLRVLH